MKLLGAIYDQFLGILERYNELLNCDLEGNIPLQLHTGFRFAAELSEEQGRAKLNIPEE